MSLDREIIPLHLGSNFPSREVYFFGECCKESGKSRIPGYASLRLKYPHQGDVLVFSLEEIPLWESYVPSNVPEYDFTSRFGKPKAAVEAELVNPLIAEHPDLDMLEVKGGPLLFFYETERGLVMKHTNVLDQAIDIHSRLIRKSLIALRRQDYRAARLALVELNQKLRAMDDFDSGRISLEKRIKELYISLIRDIVREPN